MAPVRTVNSFDLYIRKSVESILSLVPRHKGLRIALIVETRNAESPTPVSIYKSPSLTIDDSIDWSQWWLYIIHLMRRSRCFVFDNQFEVAKFLWCQTQSVQLRLIPYMYVCPTSAHWGFRHGYRRYKDNTFLRETTLFSWKSMV